MKKGTDKEEKYLAMNPRGFKKYGRVLFLQPEGNVCRDFRNSQTQYPVERMALGAG